MLILKTLPYSTFSTFSVLSMQTKISEKGSIVETKTFSY